MIEYDKQQEKLLNLLHSFLLKVANKTEKLINKYPQFESYINKEIDFEEDKGVRYVIQLLRDNKEDFIKEFTEDESCMRDLQEFQGLSIPYWVLKLCEYPAYLITCALLRKALNECLKESKQETPDDFKELYE